MTAKTLEPVAIASKGPVAFFVKWTDAGHPLRGKIELVTLESALSYAEKARQDTFEALVAAATDAAIKYANGYAVDFRAVLLEALAGKKGSHE